MRMSIKRYLGIIIFSLLISIPLLIPYLHPGYFPTHDGEWAVVRLSDMVRELRDFQFPARYSGNLNFGYGYPLFNFAYPFPYYVGAITHFLGLGFVDTIKLLFAITVPFSAFFMFLLSRNIWKNNFAGIISSALYIYFSYRLVDLFVRGSIGESFALAIFPVILLTLSKLFESPKSYWLIAVGSLSFAALILSHNIMAVLFGLTLIVFFIANFLSNGKKIIKPFLSILVLGFILSAFFSLPALLEKNNILLSQIPISDRDLYFVSVEQLLFSPWGYGIPTDPVNGFSYQIGWPLLIILASCFLVFIYRFFMKLKITKEQEFAMILFVSILFLSILLFPISKPIWKLPLLSEINYPWIMLSQLGLLTCLLSGYLANFKYTKHIALISVLIALLIYVPLAKPQTYIDKGDDYYFTNDATTTSSRELMPLWVKEFPFQRPQQKVEVLKGHAGINNLSFNSKRLTFSLYTPSDAKVRINSIYYPGWQIFDNGQKIFPSYNNKYGVMDINLSKGQHNVVATFSETRLRQVSDLISLFGLFFLGLYLLKGVKSYVNYKK